MIDPNLMFRTLNPKRLSGKLLGYVELRANWLDPETRDTYPRHEAIPVDCHLLRRMIESDPEAQIFSMADSVGDPARWDDLIVMALREDPTWRPQDGDRPARENPLLSVPEPVQKKRGPGFD